MNSFKQNLKDGKGYEHLVCAFQNGLFISGNHQATAYLNQGNHHKTDLFISGATIGYLRGEVKKEANSARTGRLSIERHHEYPGTSRPNKPGWFHEYQTKEKRRDWIYWVLPPGPKRKEMGIALFSMDALASVLPVIERDYHKWHHYNHRKMKAWRAGRGAPPPVFAQDHGYHGMQYYAETHSNQSYMSVCWVISSGILFPYMEQYSAGKFRLYHEEDILFNIQHDDTALAFYNSLYRSDGSYIYPWDKR